MKKIGVIILTLSLVLGIFPQTAFAAEIPATDKDFTTYLEEISTIRGFEVTEEDVDLSLAMNGKIQDDFDTVNEVEAYLGEVIKADYSNLNGIFSTYNLDQATLTGLLNEYGDDLSDYIFINDLDFALNFYTSIGELEQEEDFNEELDFDLSLYMDILNQLGVTEAELKNLENHFLSISDSISSAEGLAKMEDLSNRMMTFAQSLFDKALNDENYKPNDIEIAEFASLYEELLANLKLKVVFYISVNGIEKQYSITELMKMEEIKDADYKVAFYNEASELLADVVITSDFINSNLENMIENVEREDKVIDKKSEAVQTIKGAKLPKTAANYIPKALLGLSIVILGMLFIRKLRNDKGETCEKQI